MASYNKEQAAGDARWNSVAIAMRVFNLDLGGAMNWVCEYHYQKQDEFLALCKKVPSFGSEVDNALEEYVELMGNWTRANYAWNFESRRYFGDKGPEVQQKGWVPLMPRLVLGEWAAGEHGDNRVRSDF